MLESQLTPLSETIEICGSGRRIVIKQFGGVAYLPAAQQMEQFASNREAGELDQIWLLQHQPVYTQGTSCTQTTLLPTDIPLVKTDRGGQITYHGPGQIVIYPLLKIKEYGLGVKSFIGKLEQSVIDVLLGYDVIGERRPDAPGVYVDGAKIAALGLRIRRGTSYHGLSLNVVMDLAPFTNIDPCGYAGLRVTQISDLTEVANLKGVQDALLKRFLDLI